MPRHALLLPFITATLITGCAGAPAPPAALPAETAESASGARYVSADTPATTFWNPYAVVVGLGGRELRGCGGDPATMVQDGATR